MTRVKSAIGIFIFILALCIFSACSIKHQMNEYITLLEVIQTEMVNNNYDNALKTADAMADSWNNNFKKLNPFLKGETLLEIEASISRIKAYTITESDELYAETEMLKNRMKRISENEMPYWYNILTQIQGVFYFKGETNQ